jgi:hypothetical protein
MIWQSNDERLCHEEVLYRSDKWLSMSWEILVRISASSFGTVEALSDKTSLFTARGQQQKRHEWISEIMTLSLLKRANWVCANAPTAIFRHRSILHHRMKHGVCGITRNMFWIRCALTAFASANNTPHFRVGSTIWHEFRNFQNLLNELGLWKKLKPQSKVKIEAWTPWHALISERWKNRIVRLEEQKQNSLLRCQITEIHLNHQHMRRG